VIRSVDLLLRPTWEIFIHFAIKDIAIVVSLGLQLPTQHLGARGDGMNSTTTWTAPSLRQGSSGAFVDDSYFRRF
jgi:hypothetical protein